ncbi:GGDEF and EAL domain-containing protein [Azorhizobium doebereinerae]|uniref:GGDEF and EAL domain-containing protein n=1 Tax=Azorhizobium doebereinerae TaxID=281091 RepID=UPI0012EC8EBE|nr:GGDEF and EAL domain-containing protein [Azorhizobium doebereinerae]
MSGRRTKPLATASGMIGGRPPARLDTLDGTLAALSATKCAVYRWDLRSDQIDWSPNAAEIFGADALHHLSTGAAFRKAGGLAPAGASRAPAAAPPEGTPYESTLRLQLSPGDPPAWALDQGRWFAAPDGGPAVAVGTVHLLPYGSGRLSGGALDPLTGAPTRRHLGEALAILPRGPAARWALMLVGLDDLGRINDRFGFDAADRVLVALADHLRRCIKPENLLIRFSGNKFAVVLDDMDPAGLLAFGEAMIEDIRKTLLPIGDGQIPVSATIGAITAPQDAIGPDEIIARLQQAHEYAKRRGRGRFFLETRSNREDTRRLVNLRMADEIVQAMEQDQITLAFQPVVRAGDRTLAFSEALARIAPERGGHRYSGHRLVAAAEALGLMGGLDRRVLEKAVAAMRQDPELRLSVNVSAASISDEQWMRLFQRNVDASVGPRLILELTETVAVDHLPAARQFIANVRKSGARIAIDDFGAGATSFRNLRKLDVDLVKIDGSFVRNMTHSPDDQAFVRALLTLARQLGIQTVAEWVQSEEVAAPLLAWGCDYFQGELSGLARPFAPPNPAPGP